MSGSNTAISRRRLLQGAGAMWLLSVSQVSLAAVSQVVAVRVWPASSYTRVTVESNRQLKYKQFALSNPERVVVDIEDVNLNSVLKGMAAQIRADDPFIKSARVGQFDPQTVRMVFELKQNVKPQLFALAPVAGFKERLVMDLYPANAQDMQDPLLALLEDYNKGDLEKQVPPAQSGPQPGKAGRESSDCHYARPWPRRRRLRRGGEIQNARKRRGIANSSPSALSDRERGQYEGVHDAQ